MKSSLLTLTLGKVPAGVAPFPKAKHFDGYVLEFGGFALTKKFSGQLFTAYSQQRSYSREQSRAMKHPDSLQFSCEDRATLQEGPGRNQDWHGLHGEELGVWGVWVFFD